MKNEQTLTLQQLQDFAKALALKAQAGDVYFLIGDLGAGKTTFARSFIQALIGTAEEIVSPTFTILQQYQAPEFLIWHLDLYRLEEKSELRELGLEEGLEQGVFLIEWPEIASDYFPHYTKLELEFTDDADRRVLKVSEV